MSAQRDFTQKPIDQMETIWAGSYYRARSELGVTAFGLGVLQLPPGADRSGSPHMHAIDGQEEVYIPLSGSGTITIGDQQIAIDPDTAVRVGPRTSRAVSSGPDGLRVLVAGGTPGRAYEPVPQFEVGAPEPQPAELPGMKAQAQFGDDSDDSDFSVAKLGELEGFVGQNDGVTFSRIGGALGVTGFGINVVELDDRSGESKYPPHEHAKDGQTEVYVVQGGSGQLVLDGERIDAGSGEMLAVGPERTRQWIAGSDGLRIIAVGAPTGTAYVPRER